MSLNPHRKVNEGAKARSFFPRDVHEINFVAIHRAKTGLGFFNSLANDNSYLILSENLCHPVLH